MVQNGTLWALQDPSVLWSVTSLWVGPLTTRELSSFARLKGLQTMMDPGPMLPISSLNPHKRCLGIRWPCFCQCEDNSSISSFSLSWCLWSSGSSSVSPSELPTPSVTENISSQGKLSPSAYKKGKELFSTKTVSFPEFPEYHAPDMISEWFPTTF